MTIPETEMNKLHKFFEIHCRGFGLCDFVRDGQAYENPITQALFQMFLLGYESQPHILGTDLKPRVYGRVVGGKLLAYVEGKELDRQTSVVFTNTVSELNSLTVTFIGTDIMEGTDHGA